ncbi:TerD family protein [Streptomyces sp. L2]|uniref:TerD family protein n=1 Tax=Streptomyces sp. L2 TaxID=2162665 RepID=UPI00101283ED|nr:TerD family protein [Streptomyces sp. L2]
MTAELVRGQNHPLTQLRLEIRISAGAPVLAGATLGDENGVVHGAEWVAHPGAPALPGIEVSQQAAAEHRLAVDLAALPEAVHRVTVLLALPDQAGGPVRFGAVAAPCATVTGLDGTCIARFALTGLDAESAVVALELYRRQGAWKVRAVGQGYAGGLTALLTDQGLPGAAELAAVVQDAVDRGLSRAIPAQSSAPLQDPVPPHAADRILGAAQQADAPPQLGPTQHGGGTLPRHHDGLTQPHNGLTQPHNGLTQPHNGLAQPHDGLPPQGTVPLQEGVPSQDPPPAPGRGGPVDYTHPRRGQPSAPLSSPAALSPAAPPPVASAPSEPGGQAARPVAGDATGWSMDERLYNQVWGMFEDLARTTAAYRSAVDFADSRMEKELDQALADPRKRLGGAGEAAREAAHARRSQLVDQARAVLDRDLAQLTAEAEVVEPALPPAYARWDNPVWHAYRVPDEQPMALRLGDLHLPESAPLRIPMLVRLPLERGLWIDCGPATAPDGTFLDSDEVRPLALRTAVALAARLLVVHPAGEFAVEVIDPAGAAARTLEPLTRSGAPVTPPAAGAAGVTDVLERLTRRVDLVQMAVRGGAAESLPPDLDTARQLLIVNDFPHGFDDRAVTRLRYLADEGPAVGVHLLMVADREDAAAYGPLLDPLWRSLMRLTPVPDDHLADPWIGHAWTYEPSLVPPDSGILAQVLGEIAAAYVKDK